MPNMGELLNHISVEISRDRTVQLFILKRDVDDAYGQVKLSEETSRQCVFAITEGKFSGYYRFKKGIYGLADIPCCLIKSNRSNKQYSARLTRWLDRLTHFEKAIQHITGSNLKSTDYLSRYSGREGHDGKNYDEVYVINILAKQANLNLKYGKLFADQSKCSKTITERKKNDSETQVERKTNQSQTNGTFENKYHVNETKQNKITTSNISSKLAL